MYHSDTIILQCERITHFRTAIRRSVIHQQDLQIFIGLSANRLNTLFQIFFYFVHRYDHCDQMLFQHPNSSNYIMLYFRQNTLQLFYDEPEAFCPAICQ